MKTDKAAIIQALEYEIDSTLARIKHSKNQITDAEVQTIIAKIEIDCLTLAVKRFENRIKQFQDLPE